VKFVILVRRIARKEISPSYLGKARVWCQDPTKNQLGQLIEAFDTNISPIWLLNRGVLPFDIHVIYLIPSHLIFYRLSRFSRP